MNEAMDGNDRLEQLKEQIRQVSYQEYRIQKAREDNRYRRNEALRKQKNIKGEMESVIKEIFFKNEIANREERALLSDKIEKFAFNQQDMKEQIIKLIDYIKNPSALEVVYEERRKQLEKNYLERKEVLEAEIDIVKDKLKCEQSKLYNFIRKRIETIDCPFSFLLEGEKMKEKEILSYIHSLTDEKFESMTDLRKALDNSGKYSRDFQNLAMLLACLITEGSTDDR